MTGIKNTWDKKLQFIAKILGNLQEEVANAPAPTSPEAQETLLEEAQQVFVCWKVNFLRSIKIYKDATASTKETTKEKPETGGVESRPHSPTRPKNPSTSDAKALRPNTWETSLPSMQMKAWFKKWTNYMRASGWGQEENHETQLVYLCTVV